MSTASGLTPIIKSLQIKVVGKCKANCNHNIYNITGHLFAISLCPTQSLRSHSVFIVYLLKGKQQKYLTLDSVELTFKISWKDLLEFIMSKLHAVVSMEKHLLSSS